MNDQPLGGGLQDLINKQQQGVVYLGQLVSLLKNLFPRVSGSFTLAAAATTTVANTAVQANTIVLPPTPMNASAATLQGSSKSLYITINPGAGFTVSTADGTNAAGTEQFSYVAFTPV